MIASSHSSEVLSPIALRPQSTTSCLTIKRNTPIPTRRRKSLTPPHPLRQPPDRPQRLVRLTMCSHTVSPLHTPHFDLPIQRPTEQILARMAPAQTRDPCIVALEINNLLSRHVVVEADDSSVPRCSQEFPTGAECHSTDRLDETRKTVQEAVGIVAEDVDVTAFVAGGSETPIGTLPEQQISTNNVVNQKKKKKHLPNQHTSQNSPSYSSP